MATSKGSWLSWCGVQAAAEFTEAQKCQIFRARRVYYQHCGVLTAARIKIAPWLQVGAALLDLQ